MSLDAYIPPSRQTEKPRDSYQWIGKSMKRVEDPRLLVGRGIFADDINLPDMAHSAILRSPHAHPQPGAAGCERTRIAKEVGMTVSALKGATRALASVAVAAGGTVVGAVAIIDRGEEPVRFDVPLDALVQIPLPAYESGVCPMCARGEPVSKPGSRPSSS